MQKGPMERAFFGPELQKAQVLHPFFTARSYVLGEMI